MEHFGRAIEQSRSLIKKDGEVVRIDRAKRPSKDSVAHLARHSNLIKSVTDDGTLAPEEARFVVGWDCATWFVRNETEGETVWEPSAVSSGAQSLSVLMRVGREGCPTSFVVHGGNAPLFTGLASTPPAWLHDCSWNLCRITSRGVGSHNASFLVSSSPDGLKVILR